MAQMNDVSGLRSGRGRGRPRIDKPHPIDVLVGRRVRLRRTLLGMSQEKLGDAIGLTFQQVQKYERGANRIGSSRLWELSQVLDVPVAFFFEGAVDAAAAEAGGLAEEGAAYQPPGSEAQDKVSDRETMELVRAYKRISDPAVRRRIAELVKSLGQAVDGAG